MEFIVCLLCKCNECKPHILYEMPEKEVLKSHIELTFYLLSFNIFRGI